MMNREKIILRTSLFGILVNLFLVISKAAVGFLAGSVSIVLDAVNNLTDMLSATVTIIGTKLANRAPDREHPFGHGRIEYVAAVGVGLIILFAGATALLEAVPKIFHPELAEYSLTTILVVSIAVLVKFFFGRYVKKNGEEAKSGSLEATGTDALMDSLLSFGTLVGALVSMVFGISIDGVIGAIIAIFIIRTSLEILSEGWIDIIGKRVDAKFSKKIKRRISKFPEVHGVYDLVLHSYGPMETIGSVHIQVRDDMTAREIHKLTREITRKIFEDYRVILTIGIYAENTTTKENRRIFKEIEKIVEEEKEILQTHGFYVDEERKTVAFDIIVDFNCREKEKLRGKLVRKLETEFPEYQFYITVDLDVSD